MPTAEDDSPYPEVRSAVANFDDPEMPVSTIRAWVIGLVWSILLPGMNQFFYFRYPSVVIGGVRVLSYSLTVDPDVGAGAERPIIADSSPPFKDGHFQSILGDSNDIAPTRILFLISHSQHLYLHLQMRMLECADRKFIVIILMTHCLVL
jgi:hypothetical protein